MRFQMINKWKSWLIGFAALVLSACGGSGSSNDVLGFFSTGQVKSQAGSNTVGFYAASRFAEQVSFGTSPALVEEIRLKGFEKWIDDQFKLPVSQIDITPFLGYTTTQICFIKSLSVQQWGTIWTINKIGPKVLNVITVRPMKIMRVS